MSMSRWSIFLLPLDTVLDRRIVVCPLVLSLSRKMELSKQ
jgi:hypothetical protein